MPANSPILISQSLTGILTGASPFINGGLNNDLSQGIWVDEFRFSMTTERVDDGAWVRAFARLPSSCSSCWEYGAHQGLHSCGFAL
jgi:hypothetical protein